MNPANQFVTIVDNIPGLTPQIQQALLQGVNYIDLNDLAGSQQYIDYARSVADGVVNGTSDGGQGLEYLISIVGPVAAALSYIHTYLESAADGHQIFTGAEQITLPDLPLIQYAALGQLIVQANHLIDAWNLAVQNGNMNADNFAGAQAVEDQLLDLAGGMAATRDGLLHLLQSLPQ